MDRETKTLIEALMQDLKFKNALSMAKKLNIEDSEMEKIASICEVHLAHNAKLGDGRIQDLYGILKLDRFCNDADVIKSNFRNISKAIHPDKNGYPGTNEAFTIVYQAREVLMNPETKAAYDKKLMEVNSGLGMKLVDYSSDDELGVDDVDYSDG